MQLLTWRLSVGTSGTATIGGLICYPTGSGWSHQQIVCLNPAGSGKGKLVKVVTSSQASTETVVFDYTPPSITSVVPANGPTSGLIPITINGLLPPSLPFLPSSLI